MKHQPPVLEQQVNYHPEYSDPPELSQGKVPQKNLARSAWTAVNLNHENNNDDEQIKIMETSDNSRAQFTSSISPPNREEQDDSISLVLQSITSPKLRLAHDIGDGLGV